MPFWELSRDRARDFFTNWSGSDLPIPRRLGVTVKNRIRAARHGCCGNHGAPGC
jgi:hypothetical protein